VTTDAHSNHLLTVAG